MQICKRLTQEEARKLQREDSGFLDRAWAIEILSIKVNELLLLVSDCLILFNSMSFLLLVSDTRVSTRDVYETARTRTALGPSVGSPVASSPSSPW